MTNVWLRLPVVAGRPASAYFMVQGGPTLTRLSGVTSPDAERIELHQGGMSGNMATMRPIDGVDVPAGAIVSFAPGGNHAMVFGLDPSVRPGSALSLDLRFANGRAISGQARVVAADAPAPAAAD